MRALAQLALWFYLGALAAGAHAQEKAMFRPANGSPYRVGSHPAAVAVTDVNRDGKLDVLAANQESNNVSVLLGDARSGFRAAPGSPFDAGPKPHLIVVGDLNNDRKPDVVVTEHDSNDVRVFLGDGTGRFAAARGSPFQALRGAKPHNHGLALADFNRDGNPDITTSNQDDNSVSVLLGDGKGSLRPAPGSPFPVGNSPYPHAIGDVNEDGNLDIVTPNVRGNSLTVLLGDGKGSFHAAVGSPHGVANRPFYAALGDVNRDGHLDVVTTHDDITLASVLLGDGRGGFAGATTFDTRHQGWKVCLRDINGDGGLDLVTGAGHYVVVLLGDRTGRFLPAPGSPYQTGNWVSSLAVEDLNGDGKPDIVASNAEQNTITLLLRN